jgi:hypothetical protein
MNQNRHTVPSPSERENEPPITLNKHTLPIAVSTRYLGIIIDQRLTWSPHLRDKLLVDLDLHRL